LTAHPIISSNTHNEDGTLQTYTLEFTIYSSMNNLKGFQA